MTLANVVSATGSPDIPYDSELGFPGKCQFRNRGCNLQRRTDDAFNRASVPNHERGRKKKAKPNDLIHGQLKSRRLESGQPHNIKLQNPHPM